MSYHILLFFILITIFQSIYTSINFNPIIKVAGPMHRLKQAGKPLPAKLPMIFIARIVLPGLLAIGLCAAIWLGGTVYFLDRLSANNHIGFYAGKEMFLAGEITFMARRLQSAAKSSGQLAGRISHAELENVIDEFDVNHLKLLAALSPGDGSVPAADSAYQPPHEKQVKAFIEAARGFLGSENASSIPGALDTTDISQALNNMVGKIELSDAGGRKSLMWFNFLSLAALIGANITILFYMGLPFLRNTHACLLLAQTSAQRLSDLEKVSGDAIMIIDRKLCVVSANEAACAMTGQPPDQVIGAVISSLYAGPYYIEIVSAYKEALAQSQPKTFRKYTELPNGGNGWFEYLINPSTDGIVVIIRNVTGQKNHEDALRSGEERATAMLQFSSDAVIAFNDHGVIESFNLSAESVFGYELREILGHPVRTLMADNAAFAQHRHITDFNSRDLASLAAGIRLEGKRKGGGLFPARLIVNEIWNKDRRAFVATIHDLTEEVTAQNQLRDAVERFDLCVRGSDSAIWDLDTISGNLFLAPRLKQLLGYGEEHKISTISELYALVHPDDLTHMRAQLEQLPKSSTPGIESIFRLRARGGEYLWFQSKGAIRHNKAGLAERAAGSMTEITARVHAEEELRRHRDHLVKMVDAQTRQIKKSEARLATAINAISDGLCLLDQNKLILLVNRHMKGLYPEVSEILHPGVALEDVFEELLEKNRYNDERKRIFANHYDEMRSDQESGELEHPGGGWIRITRAKTTDGGQIILHTDITQYKAQEARLQAQARELENALGKEKEINTLHKQFVSMASHEFRTPLAIIDGSAQLLGREIEKLSPERVRQRTEKIRGAVTRMTKLIESTLTVARLDAGKVDIAPGECDLRAVITDIMERQQELSAAHKLSCDLAELPGHIIADTKAIDQVMTNLLSNAVKYSPNHPGIHIKGWQEGAYAVISVRDHGLGIADADMPKLFSRFFRAQNSTGIVGTGIGLNLVRELVNMHGGNVQVESRSGAGSTFTVYLPVDGPQSEAA